GLFGVVGGDVVGEVVEVVEYVAAECFAGGFEPFADEFFGEVAVVEVDDVVECGEALVGVGLGGFEVVAELPEVDGDEVGGEGVAAVVVDGQVGDVVVGGGLECAAHLGHGGVEGVGWSGGVGVRPEGGGEGVAAGSVGTDGEVQQYFPLFGGQVGDQVF